MQVDNIGGVNVNERVVNANLGVHVNNDGGINVNEREANVNLLVQVEDEEEACLEIAVLKRWKKKNGRKSF